MLAAFDSRASHVRHSAKKTGGGSGLSSELNSAEVSPQSDERDEWRKVRGQAVAPAATVPSKEIEARSRSKEMEATTAEVKARRDGQKPPADGKIDGKSRRAAEVTRSESALDGRADGRAGDRAVEAVKPLEEMAAEATEAISVRLAQEAKEPPRSLHAVLEAHLTCPITQELMRDPVITVADGHCYERAAIEHWLALHDTSPLTGEPLETKRLAPNVALRSLVCDYLRE